MNAAITQAIWFVREFVALCLLLATASAAVVTLAALIGGNP